MFRKVLLAGAGLSLVAGLAMAQETPPAKALNADKKPAAATTAEPTAGVL
jgi:hypothetical protein